MKSVTPEIHVNAAHIVVMALLLMPTLALPVYADTTQTDSFGVDFGPDDRLTDRGNGYVSKGAEVNVYNLTGGLDDPNMNLNIQTWDEMKINGTYSGAVYAESYLELDFVSQVHENGLPYSFVATGTHVNWSSTILLNGATEAWVRLPWVGDVYEFITLSLWEVDSFDVTLDVDSIENGTRANITGGNASKVYQTYWGFDWWSLDGYAGIQGFESRYHFPDEFDQFPWSLDAVPGAIDHCDISYTGYCLGAEDVSSFLHPNSWLLHGTDGCPTDVDGDGPDGGCLPESFVEGRKENFDMEYSGNRWYADVNHFFDPDQMYYIATTAILKNQSKAVIALTEESTNGGNFNTTVNHGVLYEDIGEWEESKDLPEVESGWSFIFVGGQGAGLTGVHIPARFNQTVWFQAHLEPATAFQNITVTLPVLFEGTEAYHYCYVAFAYHGNGTRAAWTLSDPGGVAHGDGDYPVGAQDWEMGLGYGYKNMVNGCMGARNGLYDSDGGSSDSIFEGQFQQSLTASDFIKFTIGNIPCDSWNYVAPGNGHCDLTDLYAYTPAVGAEYYTIGITLNPYMWCWDAYSIDLTHTPECPQEGVPMDCNIPVGTDYCYEGPHEYRLLAHDGDAGFMVSDTILREPITLAAVGSWQVPSRIGGSTYSYNLAANVQYTEGFWVAPAIPYAHPFADTVYDYRTSVAGGNENTACFFTTTQRDDGKCHNLFGVADQYWAAVDWTNPSTWVHMLDAMKYMLMGFFVEIWNGMQNMDGTLMGGFVHSIEAVAELGHWLFLNLPKIVDTIINASIWILDNVDLILETLLIGLGAWLFYFGLRIIMLIASHIKLTMLRGPFE